MMWWILSTMKNTLNVQDTGVSDEFTYFYVCPSYFTDSFKMLPQVSVK